MLHRNAIPTSTIIALLFIGGIATTQLIPIDYSPLLMGATLLALLCAPSTNAQHLLQPLYIWGFAALCVYYQNYTYYIRTKQFNDTKCAIKAIITDIQRTNTQHHPYKVRLKTNEIQPHKMAPEWSNTTLLIDVFCNEKPHVQCGDYVHIDSLYLKPTYAPSFTSYLIKNNINYSLFTKKLAATTIEQRKNTYLAMRSTLLNTINRHLSEKASWFFASLFLGNKNTNNKKLELLKERFTQWGIAHLLARSGLHLLTLLWIWSMLMKFLFFVPLRIRQLFFILLTCLYHFLSWPSVPFCRALYTFTLYSLCIALRIRPHTLHILSMVCLTSLMLNPIQLFSLDFQLSFALTLALIVLQNASTTEQQHTKYCPQAH